MYGSQLLGDEVDWHVAKHKRQLESATRTIEDMSAKRIEKQAMAAAEAAAAEVAGQLQQRADELKLREQKLEYQHGKALQQMEEFKKQQAVMLEFERAEMQQMLDRERAAIQHERQESEAKLKHEWRRIELTNEVARVFLKQTAHAVATQKAAVDTKTAAETQMRLVKEMRQKFFAESEAQMLQREQERTASDASSQRVLQLESEVSEMHAEVARLREVAKEAERRTFLAQRVLDMQSALAQSEMNNHCSQSANVSGIKPASPLGQKPPVIDADPRRANSSPSEDAELSRPSELLEPVKSPAPQQQWEQASPPSLGPEPSPGDSGKVMLEPKPEPQEPEPKPTVPKPAVSEPRPKEKREQQLTEPEPTEPEPETELELEPQPEPEPMVPQPAVSEPSPKEEQEQEPTEPGPTEPEPEAELQLELEPEMQPKPKEPEPPGCESEVKAHAAIPLPSSLSQLNESMRQVSDPVTALADPFATLRALEAAFAGPPSAAMQTDYSMLLDEGIPPEPLPKRSDFDVEATEAHAQAEGQVELVAKPARIDPTRSTFGGEAVE